MVTKKIAFLLLMATALSANAQESEKESLLSLINKNKGDTAEVNALTYLATQESEADSMVKYVNQALAIAERIDFQKGIADCNLVFAKINFNDNFSLSIQYSLDALAIFKNIKDYPGIATACLSLQGGYRDGIADYRSSLEYAFAGKQIAEKHNPRMYLWYKGHRILPLLLGEIAQTYVLMNKPDSALIYVQKCLGEKELFNGEEYEFGIYLLAYIQNIQGKSEQALKNYHKALPLAIQEGFPWDTLQIYSGMSSLFSNTGQLDSSMHYAQIVVNGWNNQSEYKNYLEALKNLANVYRLKGKPDSALKYLELSISIRDSIFSNDRARETQRVTFDDNMKQKDLIASQLKYKNRVELYALMGGILAMLLVAGLLFRNNRHKQKAKERVEKAYSELKSTQQQLIQSEKMASLGELTAGIAHEIQNPLNFVNNFSEVNKEFIDEMQQEMDKGNLADAKAISNNIRDNEDKIIFHGKRADAIVKGMLQHSRASSGQKELTDINALADEYLRLSYHGLRAKDKTFNALFKTDFDNSIRKINIIPQDIGRVLLNLYNNAFYAVSEKKKSEVETYEPTVSVTTKKINDKVELTVKDNGNGIPQKVLDKIFQPFFTTKPTGQGTGLGLSLSYDIVKAHGGEIKVETKEGEGSEFVILLPFKIN